MNAFLVELTNRPGELARVAEAVAAADINIDSLSAGVCGDCGNFAFLTSNESSTRNALQGAGIQFREVEIVDAQLAQRPGTLAQAARRLADAGVNIEAILPTGMESAAFLTDNPAKAKEVLAGVGSTSR